MIVVMGYSFPAFYGQMMGAHLATAADNEFVIGLIGAISLLCGGFGGVFFGWLLDRLKAYKLITIILVLILVMLFLVYSFLIELGNILVDAVLVSLIGLILMSLWSTGQNFGGELIHPEKESIYVLICSALASTVAVPFMALTQETIDSAVAFGSTRFSAAQVVGFMFTTLTILSLPFYAMVKGSMNRTNQIQPASSQQQVHSHSEFNLPVTPVNQSQTENKK